MNSYPIGSKQRLGRLWSMKMTHDIITSIIGYVITVGGFLYWLFVAKPENIKRTVRTVFWIAVRTALLFVLLLALCRISQVSVWKAYIVICVILLSSLLSGGALVILYAIQQWILGFPDGKLLCLKPFNRHRESKDSEAVNELVGKTGIACTPLHPGGTVTIDGCKYEASCDFGFVDKDSQVTVVEKRSFGLLVRPVNDT